MTIWNNPCMYFSSESIFRNFFQDHLMQGFASIVFALRSLHGTTARSVCRMIIPALCCVLLLQLTACGTRRPEYVPPAGTAPAARKVVENAYSQVGARYRSGGCTPSKGFDCSGLVQWAYASSGIKVPRITADQARVGRLVSPNSLQPADILVFKNGRGRRGLHTAIYTGNGRFIHSPSNGQRVRTDSLELDHWKNTFIGARRVIQ